MRTSLPPAPALSKVLMASALALSAFVSRAAFAGDKTYEIQQSVPAATVGAPGKASLTVQGKNGWHVNEEAPITLTLKADEGVALPKAKLVRADLVQSTKDAAKFEIPFSASASGKKTITAEARFVMCQEQACKPEKETVSLEVQVAAAGEPAPAAKDKAGGKTKKPKSAAR
jgi:hypothetical protein